MAEADLRKKIELLYTGRSRNAARFRYALIGFDLGTIGFFIATAPVTPTPGLFVADVAIGALILADFLARLWIAPDKPRMLRQLYTLADVVVILSLVLAPLFAQNMAFLRVLRALRLLHSYHVLRDLRRETPFFRRNEEVIVSTVNLGVFIFLVTALVFVLQFGENPDIESYVDALYFTVATLTTTGFGDITLTGPLGRLLAVFIMVVGVALFLRLAQSIFRPHKVSHACPKCGLSRHESDAVHCKHCGVILKIETEGAG
ncbi:MAG: potassium channel family protein [Rhodospirillales bacterium]|nr:potassium channel family protein [Rhodospirillales bacterium]MDH3917828.1 potassium channel family protein [Rhodospirillales bacterium]